MAALASTNSKGFNGRPNGGSTRMKSMPIGARKKIGTVKTTATRKRLRMSRAMACISMPGPCPISAMSSGSAWVEASSLAAAPASGWWRCEVRASKVSLCGTQRCRGTTSPRQWKPQSRTACSNSIWLTRVASYWIVAVAEPKLAATSNTPFRPRRCFSITRGSSGVLKPETSTVVVVIYRNSGLIRFGAVRHWSRVWVGIWG